MSLFDLTRVDSDPLLVRVTVLEIDAPVCTLDPHTCSRLCLRLTVTTAECIKPVDLFLDLGVGLAFVLGQVPVELLQQVDAWLETAACATWPEIVPSS